MLLWRRSTAGLARFSTSNEGEGGLGVVISQNDPEVERAEQGVQEEEKDIDLSKVKGAKEGNSGLYMIMYTCGVCEHRQARTFTKDGYHKGVVIIRCGSCENYHLIADNLGWFKDSKTNIEDIMRD